MQSDAASESGSISVLSNNNSVSSSSKSNKTSSKASGNTPAKPSASASSKAESNNLVFNDTVLEEAFRYALKKPTGVITKQDCINAKITDIDIYCENTDYTAVELKNAYGHLLCSIKPMDGQKFFKGTIKNYSVLSQIPDLTGFSYYCENDDKSVKNYTFDIKSIEAIKTLTCISLGTYSENCNYNLTNTELLTKFPKLNRLFIIGCKGVNFDAVGKLTYLTKLQLTRTGISDLTCLKNLTNLEELDLDNYVCDGVFYRINKIKDITPLRNMKKLKGLSISYNYVEDISVVKELPALTDFNCRANKITDFSPLDGRNITVYKDDNPAADLK